LSTTTEAEYTGEENTGDVATVVPVENPEVHPIGEHVHEDGTVHVHTPDCTGSCIEKKP
jgi:hypothetical protein